MYRPIPVNLTDSDYEAIAQAEAMPIYRRSMTGARGNLVGLVGEVAIRSTLDAMAIPYQWNGQTTHDLTICGWTADVKTKRRTVAIPPLAHWTASLPAYNHDHQRPSTLIFVSASCTGDGTKPRDYGPVYIVGVISMPRFDKVATFRPKGEVDPDNGMSQWCDTWTMDCGDLAPFDESARWMGFHRIATA